MPSIDTWSGITLEAVPACMTVTETTAELTGSMLLDTKVCNPEIIEAATGTGSFANWGIAACPPLPKTVILKPSAEAITGPE